MFKICLLFLIFGCVTWATSDSADTSNEIEHKPPVNLDPALRRALLKAIENLEGEAESDSTEDNLEYPTTEDSEILKTGDEDTERTPENGPTDQIPAVQYHSFVVDGHKAFENDLKSKHADKEETIDPVSDEDIEPRETSNLNALTQTRSIQTSIVSESKVSSSGKEVSKRPETTTKKAVTTTTAPKPTHNEDGANIEELENHEVQVFQAPLVAAFTVHQDAQGLPRKVVPIFKEAVRKPITATLPVTRMNLSPVKPQNTIITQSIQLPQNQGFVDPLTQQQVPVQQQQVPFVPQFQQQNQYQQYLQQQLEQKQRLLEDQLQKLQNQQRQHEELLRQQQLIQQQQQLLFVQKEQQRQQERIAEEQRLRQQQFLEQQRILQSQSSVQNNFARQQLPKNNFPATSVSFQPSISAEALVNGGKSQQLLPQREAVDFLVHLRSGQQVPFPLQQTAPITPNIHLQVPHEKPFQNDFIGKNNQNSGSIRVFRQDSGTGNFGLNSNDVFSRNNNNFNGNFKRFPTRTHDNELKSLLYRSGLTHGGRSQEDLSIISKVLSLNHGVPPRDFFSNSDKNIFFGESRRVENRIRPSSNGNS